MDQPLIHYEVFARRQGAGGFNLEMATEDREKALAAAEEMLEGARVAAVKVTKETRDPENGEFQSVTILKKGDFARTVKKAVVEETGPICVTPQDFYNIHARDKIGRLLEGWLARHKATPFELLHRPDLMEKLDASGVELQHAIQKVAVPEAQSTGGNVHEVMRHFQSLIQRTVDRVLEDHRKGAFPDLKQESFAEACQRLVDAPERGYLLGGAVAGHLADAKTWSDKVGLILDLADQAPAKGPPRGLAFLVLEQPLSEILRSKVGIAELLGADLDLGGQIAAFTRLAAADVVEALCRAEARIAEKMPPLGGAALRLAGWLKDRGFETVSLALFRRILTELRALRRLRPSDPHDEIEMMRALAMALTAASGPFLQLEEVREAFIERSKMLVASDFVETYLEGDRSPMQDATDLVWLLENVTGGSNKRQAMRWLMSHITSLKFESALRTAGESAAARLSQLAELHRQLGRSGAEVAGLEEVLGRIGDVAGRLEAEVKLTSALARSTGPIGQRLGALLKMAVTETAPPGPAAERARIEALRLVRLPEARSELARSPEMLGHVRALMQSPAAAA